MKLNLPKHPTKFLDGKTELPPRRRPHARRNYWKLLRRLAACARDDGKTWTIISGYRSFQHQAELYAQYLAGTGNLAAKPGHSEHNFGKAADVYVKNVAVGSSESRRKLLAKYGLALDASGEKWHVAIGPRSWWRA